MLYGEIGTTKKRTKETAMIKQFKKKKKFGRRSVARDIEKGVREAYYRGLKASQNKRVKKQQERYV